MLASLKRLRGLSGAQRQTRAGEREPLLSGEAERGAEAGEDVEGRRKATPLPFKQVLVLCLMRFGEPIAFTLIFPFIARFVEDLHVTDDPKKIGYYAGLIESLFALTTFSTVLFWGRLSDRIGRKPVLIIGLLGVTASIVAFGLSTQFWMLIVSRCIGGALNGNVAVIKSMMGEITDESNQGRAFSFLPLAWSLGSVIGPLLGGYLSHPAETFPSLFGRSTFFLAHPYALPCLVGALFPLSSALIGFFYLEETLVKRPSSSSSASSAKLGAAERAERNAAKEHQRFVQSTSTTLYAPPTLEERREELVDSGTSTPVASGSRSGSRRPSTSEARAQRNLLGDEERAVATKKAPRFMDLFTKRVVAAITTYALLALETVALDALLILFCYSPISVGGLGFPPSSIGTALSLSGLLAVSFQLLLFPPLQHRFGTVPLYRALMALWPVVFALFPVMSYAAKRGDERVVWAWLSVFLGLKSIANMSYATNMLTLTDAAPSKRLLGTLNGVGQMCSSLMRSIGPFSASSLYAFSISHPHLLNGELVFLVMVLLAFVGSASTFWLEKGGRASAGVDEE
ncbi:hypothetical protein JCM8547_002708 [Rhodosporidiobolus lusitaniae]